MSKIFKFKLSYLRDIGWKYWDPIGLLSSSDKWEDYPEFANEYDSYLMNAAGQLARGESIDAVAAYLENISTNHMGLSKTPLMRRKAIQTVQAMAKCKSSWLTD